MYNVSEQISNTNKAGVETFMTIANATFAGAERLAALNLNIFARHADRVRITNIAQMINVLQAMILTDKEKMVLTPTYHIYKMYLPFQDATLVPVKFVGLGGLKYTLDGFGVLAGPLAGANGLPVNVRKRCSQDVSLWPEINTSKDVQRMCPHGA